jgi:uncharacterized protein (DUF433 family)
MATAASWISKKPDRCGGDACVRDTRIPVWGLVEYRRLGVDDAGLLRKYPGLTPDDLAAAWEYAAAHADEIERALWENEAAMAERGPSGVPAELVRRGLALGLSEDRVRDAFEPPLTVEELRAALRRAAASGHGA